MDPRRIYVPWTEAILASLEIATQPTSLGLGPPPVARLLAIIYSAAFEAWAPFTATATGPVNGAALRRPPPERTDANKAAAVSQAIYQAALAMFSPQPGAASPATDPAVKAILAATLAKLGYSPAAPGSPPNTPSGIGLKAALDTLAARAADNANQDNGYADTSGYAPVNRATLSFGPTLRDDVVDPARWQALSYFDPTKERLRAPGFITPHWGSVKPFALANGSQFRPPPPAPWLSQNFVDQARHVIEVQRNLTIRQKVIAEFWADGPKSWLPPGHWCGLALHLSDRGDAKNSAGKPYGIDEDAKMFFGLANAILDASIATWDAKRFYDYVRPVTAIRWLFQGHTLPGLWRGFGKGWGDIQGEFWTPFQKPTFPTPPFPEYTSGHSAFSMAAATYLLNWTGTDSFGAAFYQTAPLAAEPDAAGLPVLLQWPTLTGAAIEAGESRIFGGIHFHEGNVQGLDLGRKCGLAAWTKAQTYF